MGGQGGQGGQKNTQLKNELSVLGWGGFSDLIVLFFEKVEVLFFRDDYKRKGKLTFEFPCLLKPANAGCNQRNLRNPGLVRDFFQVVNYWGGVSLGETGYVTGFFHAAILCKSGVLSTIFL